MNPIRMIVFLVQKQNESEGDAQRTGCVAQFAAGTVVLPSVVGRARYRRCCARLASHLWSHAPRMPCHRPLHAGRLSLWMGHHGDDRPWRSGTGAGVGTLSFLPEQRAAEQRAAELVGGLLVICFRWVYL